MTSRRFWVLLFALTALLRLPGFLFEVVDIDETDFLVIGRMLGAGGIPYLDIVEKKPPGPYLFYAPAALLGWRMLPMQLLAVAWIVATAWVCGRAATELSGRKEAGPAAALIAVLASCANVVSVNAELMLNLPQALALLLYVRAAPRPRVASLVGVGVASGLAALFKHQAGIVLVALGLAELLRRADGAVSPGRVPGRLVRVAAIGAGFALPWLGVAGVYAGLGLWPEFFEWNVTRNFLYSSYSAGSRLARMIEGFGLCVVLGAPLWWTLALGRVRRMGRSSASGAGLGVALVFILTVIPVSLGGRFYEHYFLQFVPALAILAAPGAAALWARARDPEAARQMGRGTRGGLAVLAFAPAVLFCAVQLGRGLTGGFPYQQPRARELASWLRANTQPDDRLFVWGHFTPIYAMAHRLPGTRFYNTSTHMGDFDPAHLPDGFDLGPFINQRDVEQTVADLDRNRPRWVVDTSPADIHHWSRVPLDRFPALAAYIARHYELVDSPAGAPVYRRR